MNLTIAESFYILIHHPEKHSVKLMEAARDAGMTGAIFLDLSLNENIIIEEGKIQVKSPNSKLLPIHQEILDIISKSSKIRKPKRWLSRLNQRAGKTKKSLLESLDNKGIIEVQHKRFLFIPYIRTWLIKVDLQEKIISQLRGIVFRNKELDSETASLLGLVQACKAHKILCNDKYEIKESKKKIKKIIESDLITEGVGTVIQEMQAAMMAAIVAASAASTAAAAASSS